MSADFDALLIQSAIWLVAPLLALAVMDIVRQRLWGRMRMPPAE